jgi:DNA mismatch endonuclease, patch repair protein
VTPEPSRTKRDSLGMQGRDVASQDPGAAKESSGGNAVISSLPPAPLASSKTVRAVMRGNRKRDTRPELHLRSALHAMGLRFRVDHPVGAPPRAPRADVAFPRQRIAVFVDGCFWHGCPAHAVRPRTNSSYWGAKIARNVARDARQTKALESAGWQVIRIWEHEESTVAAALVGEAVRAATTECRRGGRASTAGPID